MHYATAKTVRALAYSAWQFQSAVHYIRGLLLDLPFKILCVPLMCSFRIICDPWSKESNQVLNLQHILHVWYDQCTKWLQTRRHCRFFDAVCITGTYYILNSCHLCQKLLVQEKKCSNYPRWCSILARDVINIQPERRGGNCWSAERLPTVPCPPRFWQE